MPDEPNGVFIPDPENPPVFEKGDHVAVRLTQQAGVVAQIYADLGNWYYEIAHDDGRKPYLEGELVLLPEMTDHALKLYHAKARLDRAKADHAKLLALLQEANPEVFDELEQAKDAFKVAETAAKADAVTFYEYTGSRTQPYGFKVQVRKGLNTYDAAQIAEWARDEYPDLLILNEKEFKRRMTKGEMTCPHAAVVETPTGTIPQAVYDRAAEHMMIEQALATS